ncbi:MAG TPA: tRNA-(ms[2]io[6]A)-hydroxylase [Myxococcaceae bacterium]|nr:tRNA-(ms[2]io[6]A)-hydroxylase [Myxococcaceae bacterium]
MSAEKVGAGKEGAKKAEAHRPLSGEGAIQLKSTTDPRWLPQALEQFDAVLIDHAHCEKKAAANALSILQAHPEVPGLPAHMARLAREESGHLARVLKLMDERGLVLGRDNGDPYAQKLQTLVRKTQPERRLDRLLVAAVIEARSCERLALLAGGLPPGPLKRFYAELAQSEDGHQELFFRLACQAHGEQEARARVEVILTREAEIVAEIGIRPAIH